MAVLGNSSLATELRRSAAEQLSGLAAASRGESCLLDAMTAPEAAALIASSAVSELTLSSSKDEGGGRVAGQLGGLLDVQLPLACVNLLYTLCCLSPKLRRWLLAADGGRPRLRQLLPLLLHPLITARRAMARLAAAAVLLGGEADKWSGWSQSRALDSSSDAESSRGQAGGSLQPEALLRLPDVFSKGYLLPCRVAWVAVPQGPAGGAPLGEEDSSSVVVALRRQQPLLQGLVEEQRFLVHILVEERRLLRRLRDSSERTAAAAVDGGGGGASALARFVLDDAPGGGGGGHGLSPAAAQACLANIRALDLPARAAAVASALSTASSHAEASSALYEAAALSATRQGAAALSGCPTWGPAYEPLLRTAPATEEDRELWALLLQVVQRVLVSASSESCSSAAAGGDVGCRPEGAQLDSHHMTHLCIHLSLCLAQSVPQLLSAPLAASAPKTLPLALAGIGALAEARRSDGGSLSSQQQQQLPGRGGGCEAPEEPFGRRGQRLTVHLSAMAMQTLSALVRWGTRLAVRQPAHT